MIDVEVVFADDSAEQVVVFAVMPRVSEIILVQFENEVVPRPWRVDTVLHKMFSEAAPHITVHVSPA